MNQKLASLFLAILVAANFGFAQESALPFRAAVDIGHNVSATSWTMEKGQCTVGLQIVGCGLNNRTSLAFSPWLLTDYRMANFALRYLIDEEPDGDRWAFQTEYFKTWTKHDLRDFGGGIEMSNGDYEMEALWLMFIRTIRLSPDAHIHFNVHTNYYFNEKMPFSLRRPYMKKNPTQLNLMSLYEVELVKGWLIKGEAGLLDAIRMPLHFHTGVSIGRRIGPWHGHFGFSMTSTYAGLFAPTARLDYQQNLRVYDERGYDNPDKSGFGVKYDFSIHPEFSLQYYF